MSHIHRAEILSGPYHPNVFFIFSDVFCFARDHIHSPGEQSIHVVLLFLHSNYTAER